MDVAAWHIGPAAVVSNSVRHLHGPALRQRVPGGTSGRDPAVVHYKDFLSFSLIILGDQYFKNPNLSFFVAELKLEYILLIPKSINLETR